MTERIFKKRMMILDTMACKMSGGRTFIDNYLKILDKNDVVVDYITLGTDSNCIKHFKNDFDNVNEFIDLKFEYPSMYDAKKEYEQEMAFYGVFFQNPALNQMLLKKIFELLNTYIYDFIFINHADTIPAVTNYFPISKIVKSFVFTHCNQTFTDEIVYRGMFEDIYTPFLRYCIKSNPSIDVLGQKQNGVVDREFPDNMIKVIGMPLDVTKIHSYNCAPEDKEDSVLFLGRAHQGSKNIENWVKTVASTGLKAVVIVPHKKAKEAFVKLFVKENYENYEVHFNLSFEEKLAVSAKCKVCYVPSFTETFSFVVYENLNLMKLVVLEKDWSKELKLTLDDIILTNEENAVQTIIDTVKNYKQEEITKQFDNLVKFNENVEKNWAEYLNQDNMYKDIKKSEVQIIKGLIKKNDLVSALESINRNNISFTELVTLYRNLEMDRVIQTKSMSYYDKIKDSSIDSDCLF